MEKGLEMLQAQYDEFYYSMLKRPNREIFEAADKILLMTDIKDCLMLNKNKKSVKSVLVNIGKGVYTLEEIYKMFIEDGPADALWVDEGVHMLKFCLDII